MSAHPSPRPAADARHPAARSDAEREAAWHRRVLSWPAAVCGVLSLAIIASEVGPRGFMMGLLVAVIPVPAYVMLALWLDRYEAEPPQVLAQTFAWGASVAIFLSLLVNTYAEGLVASVFGPGAADVFGNVIAAPVVEEMAKGFALLALFVEMEDEFDGVVDGVVYASMVGLGFAMVENIHYYGAALNAGLESSLSTFVVRGMMAPFAHPFFTAMLGIGLGLAREAHGGRRVGPPFVGLCAAVALHAAWNIAASVEGWFVAAYAGIMVPAFIGVLGLIYLSLKRESRVIRQHLDPLVAERVLTPEELERLCSVALRLRASYDAWRIGGTARWNERREMHQVASELAFHRWRVARGLTRGPEADAAREAEYLRRLCELCLAVEARRAE